jgi:hypothetical protein
MARSKCAGVNRGMALAFDHLNERIRRVSGIFIGKGKSPLKKSSPALLYSDSKEYNRLTDRVK